MRELLAEVHHRAWTATALVSTFAVACAALGFVLPAALAAMAAGVILMWISEEESRLVAAMAPTVAAAGAAADPPAPARALAPTPACGPAVRVRDWANPFPAARPARRQRPPRGRQARRVRVAAAMPSD